MTAAQVPVGLPARAGKKARGGSRKARSAKSTSMLATVRGHAGPRPGNPSASTDDRDFVNGLFLNRQITFALMIVAVVVLPGLRSAKAVVAAGLVVNLLPIGLLAQREIRTKGRLPLWQPWAEALTAIAVVAAAPSMFRYAVLFAVGQFILGVFLHGAMPAAGAAGLTAAGFPMALKARGYPVDMTSIALFAAFIPSVTQMSARVRAMRARSDQRFHELLTGLDAVVWEGDESGMHLTYVSPQVRDIFGLDPAHLVSGYEAFVHPEDRDRWRNSRMAGSAHESSFVIDFRLVATPERIFHVRDSVKVERDPNGRPVRMRGVMVDMTRQQEAEALIRHQAMYDSLTSLPNRSLFNDELRKRIEEATLNGQGIAVLLLDLNGFKEVNDTLGHAVGDQLLQAIAGRLSAYLPDRAVVARLGGDEFAVLLYPATAPIAVTLAETVAACLQPPITIEAMTIQAGASVGIALYPNDGDSPAALLRRADAAMYEAKQAGRNHVFATKDDDQANFRRLELLGELRHSLNTGDFRLYHQPKIDLRTGRIVGTEGLIRWQHRRYGLLTPKDFVELTELSGLIQPLTRWVIEEGIGQARRWRDAGFELTVALNLSVRNFFDQGLPAFIAARLSEYDLHGEAIVLEITESEVMADRALARSALSAFRSLGVRISIDDFGTGYSSLSQLQALPIDEIKVDASFVAGMLTNNQDAVIVRSIVDLGHNLGLQVVAEGAETHEQLAALRSLGCDRAQGYVISPPLAADQLTEWLSERAKIPRGANNKAPARASLPSADATADAGTSGTASNGAEPEATLLAVGPEPLGVSAPAGPRIRFGS